jgi:hypothetical protein
MQEIKIKEGIIVISKIIGIVICIYYIYKVNEYQVSWTLTVYDSLAKRYMQSTARKPAQNSEHDEKLSEPLTYKDMTEDVQESHLTSNSLLDTDLRSSGESFDSNSTNSLYFNEFNEEPEASGLKNQAVQSNQSSDKNNAYYTKQNRSSSKQDVTDNTDGNQYDPTGNAKGKAKVEDVDKADAEGIEMPGVVGKIQEAFYDFKIKRKLILLTRKLRIYLQREKVVQWK